MHQRAWNELGRQATRDQRPETRDQRPETRDQRPETRDYVSLAVSCFSVYYELFVSDNNASDIGTFLCKKGYGNMSGNSIKQKREAMNEQPANQPQQQGASNNRPQQPPQPQAQPQKQYGQTQGNQYQQPQGAPVQQPVQPQYSSQQPQPQAPQQQYAQQQNYQNQQPAGQAPSGVNQYQNPGRLQPGNYVQEPEGEIAKLPESKRKLVSVVRGTAIVLAVLLALSALAAFTQPAEFYEGYTGEPPASAGDESFSYVAGSFILVIAAAYLAVFFIVNKTASLSRINRGCYVMFGAAAAAISGGFSILSLVIFIAITTPPSMLQAAIRQARKQQG